MLDVNIGTNYDPMKRRPGTGLVLVEPLFRICENISLTLDADTTLFCMALSNTTGFQTFYELSANGVSSSLAHVKPNSSHGAYKTTSRRTTLVMDGIAFFLMLLDTRPLLTIECLKLDMQGFELTLLRHMAPLLTDARFDFRNVYAECTCPGRPIYEVENDCSDLDAIFTRAGFTVSREYKAYCARNPKYEWTDVKAQKGSNPCEWG